MTTFLWYFMFMYDLPAYLETNIIGLYNRGYQIFDTHSYPSKQVYIMLICTHNVYVLIRQSIDVLLHRLELDLHANILVVSCGAYSLDHIGKITDISVYNPYYESMQIPRVDVVLWYGIPYDGIIYILFIRNVLYVQSMTNHLIPPPSLYNEGSRYHIEGYT